MAGCMNDGAVLDFYSDNLARLRPIHQEASGPRYRSAALVHVVGVSVQDADAGGPRIALSGVHAGRAAADGREGVGGLHTSEDVGERVGPRTRPSQGGPWWCERSKGSMTGALTSGLMSPEIRKVVDRARRAPEGRVHSLALPGGHHPQTHDGTTGGHHPARLTRRATGMESPRRYGISSRWLCSVVDGLPDECLDNLRTSWIAQKRGSSSSLSGDYSTRSSERGSALPMLCRRP